MTVAGANGHASFLVSASSTDEENAFIIWRKNPTVAEDWTVDITGHNSAFHGEWDCQLQLAVVNNEAYKVGRVEAFVVGMNNDDGISGVGTSWWHYPSGWTPRLRVGTTSTPFKLRLVYRSATQTIEAWHDPTASGQNWTFLDSMTLNEMSPGMTATNTFAFAILGNTDFGPISEGEIWADDFRIAGAVPLPPRLVVASAQWSAGFESLHLTWTNNGSQCVLQNAGAVTGSWSTVNSPWTRTGSVPQYRILFH